MKFVYGTDFHGNLSKYENIFKFAVDHELSIIHLGADILPKGSNILKAQKDFVKGYLKEFFYKCKEKNIDVLTFFGNDDSYTRKKYFREYAQLLDEVPFTKDDTTFKAYGYVQDHPFGFKNGCKLDYRGWERPETLYGNPCIPTDEGILPIFDLDEYYSKQSTVEDDLDKIDTCDVMAIHQPPWKLGLDVCADSRAVGSKSVYKWIEKKQPKIVLCGHIHESFKMSGKCKEMIGNSIVIQPGQLSRETTMVYVSINGSEIETKIFSKSE